MSLEGIDVATAHGNCANNSPQVWAQRRRRFGDSLANIDLPEMIESDRYIDTDAREPHQIVSGYHPVPAAGNDQPPGAVDVEAMLGAQALSATRPCKVVGFQPRGEGQNERRDGDGMAING